MSLRLGFEPYRLALRRPWRSAHGRRERRDGWLVIAEADGSCGFGDCAPLPEAGTESASMALRRLRYWAHRAVSRPAGALLAELPAAARATPCPAADAAVETALLDLEARRRGLPLRRLLGGDGAADRIEVNAAVGAAAALDAAALERALAAGFRVLKLKLGVAAPDQELEALAALRARLPAAVGLRLDANRAWDLASAERVLAALSRPAGGRPWIESLEEPLAAPDPRRLAALQAGCAFPLALDESLSPCPPLGAPAAPLRLALNRPPVRRLVLKPGVIGGLRPSLALARAAAAAGCSVVVTSLVESAAGLWACAQLAAALGPSPGRGRGMAHGLDTAHWLAADLGAAPRPRDGEIRLPATAGSGFAPLRPAAVGAAATAGAGAAPAPAASGPGAGPAAGSEPDPGAASRAASGTGSGAGRGAC